MKRFYAVGAVVRSHDVQTILGTQSLELTWADGMIGVIPVFTNKKKAKKYAGKFLIVELVMEEKIVSK